MDEELEAEIRGLCEAGDLQKAATLGLEGYGRELLGYLVATIRSEQDAGEVFSQLSEDLWRGLPSFGWRSSFRTWSYVLARNAASRFRRSPANQAHRRVPLSEITEVAERVRTRTLPHLRTEVKDRFEQLRRELDPDDQTLLILRVNRKLSWKEVAMVMAGSDALDGDALDREAAKFRQRFQTVKKRMYALAEQRGLLEVDREAR